MLHITRSQIPHLASKLPSHVPTRPLTPFLTRQYSARLNSNPSRHTRRPIPPRSPRLRQENTPSPPLTSQPTLETTVPVGLPSDSPTDVVTKASGAYSVLAHPALMVTRQLEMMNVLIGMLTGVEFETSRGDPPAKCDTRR